MAPGPRSICARPGQSLGCRIAALAAAQVKAFARAHKTARLVWIADGLEQGGAAEIRGGAARGGGGGRWRRGSQGRHRAAGAAGRRQRQRRPGGLGAARRAERRRRGRGARRQGAAGRQGAFPIRRLRPDKGAFRSADRIAQRGELFARGGGKFRWRRGLARLARAGAARRDCRRRRRRRGAALAVGGLLSRKGARAVHAAAEIQSRRRRPGSGRPGRPPQRSGAGRRKGRAGRGFRGVVEFCRAGRGVAAFRRTAPRQRPRRSDAGQAAPQRARARRRDVVGYAQAARRFRRGQPVFRPRRPRRRRREPADSGGARPRPLRQDLGAARRRHAARDLRAARQGGRRAVPCRRRRELVEPADFRAFRRNAQTHLRAVERRRGRAFGERPDVDHATLPPLRTLDGFGVLGAPPATAKADRRGFPRTWRRRASARILWRAGRRDRGANPRAGRFRAGVRFLQVRAFAAAIGAPGRRARFAAAAVDADFCRAADRLAGPVVALRPVAAGRRRRGFGRRLRAWHEHKRASGARRRAKSAAQRA